MNARKEILYENEYDDDAIFSRCTKLVNEKRVYTKGSIRAGPA
jgi:hypothetical protein